MIKKIIMPLALVLACVMFNTGCDGGSSESDSLLLLKAAVGDSSIYPGQPMKSISSGVQPYLNNVTDSWVMQGSANCGPTSFYMIFKYYDDHMKTSVFYDNYPSTPVAYNFNTDVTYLAIGSAFSAWLGVTSTSTINRTTMSQKIAALRYESSSNSPYYSTFKSNLTQYAYNNTTSKTPIFNTIVDNYLKKGYPVIIHLERASLQSGHFVVLVGYDEANSQVIYMDPNIDNYTYNGISTTTTTKYPNGVPTTILLKVSKSNFLGTKWYKSSSNAYLDVRAWWDGVWYGFYPATTTQVVIPTAPSGLAATVASSSQINLTWTDNSTNETGFRVERSTDGGTTYTQIATTAANVSSYSSTGLTASTTYLYRVYAYNSAGNSAYSSVASATTLAASSTNVATYTFSGVTPATAGFNAYENDVDQFPFGGDSANRNDHTEGTSAQYTAIAASDNSRWATDDPGSYDEMMFWVEMTIDEPAANITKISFTFEGYPSETASVGIWVLKAGYDWTADASWVQLGSTSITSGADGTLTCSLTENISQYVQSDGMITWIVGASEGHSDSLYIDYVKMDVTYTE